MLPFEDVLALTGLAALGFGTYQLGGPGLSAAGIDPAASGS